MNQFGMKGGAPALVRLGPDAAALRFYNGLADRQAKSAVRRLSMTSSLIASA
jgi:hypothetical protein